MENNYKKHQESIRDRVKNYSKKANAIYWSSILNLISFFIILFNIKKNYYLGFSINILLHHLIMTTSLDIFYKLLISFLCALIPSILFIILSIYIKKGKLKPLIAAFVIYILDTILLFFLNPSYLIYEDGNTYSLISAYLIHFIMIFYYIYLLITYNKIVNDSILSKKAKK